MSESCEGPIQNLAQARQVQELVAPLFQKAEKIDWARLKGIIEQWMPFILQIIAILPKTDEAGATAE